MWKDTVDIYFYRIYKNNIVFCTTDSAEQNTNTILSKITKQTKQPKALCSHYKIKKEQK